MVSVVMQLTIQLGKLGKYQITVIEGDLISVDYQRQHSSFSKNNGYLWFLCIGPRGSCHLTLTARATTNQKRDN